MSGMQRGPIISKVGLAFEVRNHLKTGLEAAEIPTSSASICCCKQGKQRLNKTSKTGEGNGKAE